MATSKELSSFYSRDDSDPRETSEGQITSVGPERKDRTRAQGSNQSTSVDSWSAPTPAAAPTPGYNALQTPGAFPFRPTTPAGVFAAAVSAPIPGGFATGGFYSPPPNNNKDGLV
jgi:hypothetical protein